MKIWLKKHWKELFLGVVAVANLLVWTPINGFIAGILLMCTLIELKNEN